MRPLATRHLSPVSGIQLIMSATRKRLLELAAVAGITDWEPSVDRSDEVIGHFQVKIIGPRRARTLRRRGVLTVSAGTSCAGRRSFAYRQFFSISRAEKATAA